MIYLLDTNVFIEAKNRYYRPSLCPGFWKLLRQQSNKGLSIDMVKNELLAGEDDLAEWVRKLPKSALFF